MKYFAFTTLKGKALLCAEKSGMLERAIRKEDGKEGYNIAPFLCFWSLFEPEIENVFKEVINLDEMLNQESCDRTDKGN